MSLDLTARQRETLATIERLTLTQGYPPSGIEIAEAMSPPISTQALFDKLRALKGKGLITRIVGVHRSIKLTEAGRSSLSVSG